MFRGTRVSALSYRMAPIAVLALVLMCVPGLRGLAGAQDGRLDPTFGGDGTVTTGFDVNDQVVGVALQRDGKIVTAGTTAPGGIFPPADIAIARYNTNGTLDTSFGSGGTVTTDLKGSDDRVGGLVIQPDGKIVVAATAITSMPGRQVTEFAVVRYKSNGALDLAFGVEGKVITSVGSKGTANAGAVALQRDGRIIVGGRRLLTFTTSDWALVRYNADGSLDTSFGVDGTVLQDVAPGGANRLSALALQADGRIVAAGVFARNQANSADIGLARFLPNGALDGSFGIGGIVVTDIARTNDTANAMVLQADGTIVVAGSTSVGQSIHFALARYTTDGVLDGRFGTNGIVTTSFPAIVDEPGSEPTGLVVDDARAVAIQADGKIVAAGRHGATEVPTPGGVDFALARYLTDGSLDASFGTNGLVTTDFGVFENPAPADIATSLAIQTDGRIVACGSTSSASLGSDFALARYQIVNRR